jgi:glycosyltransferase involved in cell wall biosynthesis
LLIARKLVFVTTHPIQYQAPVFRELTKFSDIELTVLFAMIPNEQQQGEGFGTGFRWDIPLLDGYDYRVLDNVAKRPSATHFSGCDTPAISDALQDLRPDAVIVNGWGTKTCLQALWACKRQRIPCMVRGEANDLRRRPGWKRVGQKLIVKQYSACLYIGSANRAFYERRGVPSKQLVFSPYCIDNHRFENKAVEQGSRRSDLRESWGIPEFAVCFLYCGKFETKKHPLLLLRALKMAVSHDENSNLHLLMVGDGPLRLECEAFVHENSLPVSFAGFINQSQLPKAYVATDCLALPSDSGETWGLVVNEAMACGRPAIVSDHVGCQADLVEAGVTGEVFPVGDEKKLAGMLARFAGDPGQLVVMGEAARHRVANYSPKAAAEGMRAAVLAMQ